MSGPESSTVLNAMEAQASMDSWDALNGFIEQEALAHLPDSKQVYKLRLACEEILSNIVRETSDEQSLGQQASLWLTSSLQQRPGCTRFCLQIEDDGPAFDPQLQQERDIDTSAQIENRPIGGLGLFLVQQSVDEALYQFSGGRNQYRLFMDLPHGVTGPVTPVDH